MRWLVSWDLASGIVAPAVVVGISVMVLLPRALARGESLYALPLVLLIVIAATALMFWLIRLSFVNSQGSKRPLMKLGLLLYSIGLTSTIGLLVITTGKLLNHVLRLHPLFHYETDTVYWIISVWTLLEGTHHYAYKLMYGRRDALAGMLMDGGLIDLRRPIGGAIGIQLLRMRRQR
ncbi:MAG: hypothetical protein KAR40_02490 [Candidatus Sabulitectum sp.]|nr:hypothetical protein [Candidatus Sabulitectum sp.]